MKKFYKYLILIALTVLYFDIKAQEEFTYHFGLAIPTSDFGDDDIFNDDAGLAAMGLNVGLKYLKPLNDNGLGLFGGVDLIFNSWKKDAKDMIEDYEDDVSNFPKYFTFPLSGGIQYDYVLNTETTFYGRFGLAFSFTKLTNLKFESGDKYTYGLATGFGFLIGGGVKLNEKLELDLTYWGLGEHDFDVEYVYEDGDKDEEGKRETPISLVTLTVAFYLNQ